MKFSRRSFMKTSSGLIALVSLAVLFPDISEARSYRRRARYSNPIPKQSPELVSDAQKPKTPSYEDYKALLIKKGKYDEEKSQRLGQRLETGLEANWRGLKDTLKVRVYLRESDPEAYLKKYSPNKKFEDDARNFEFSDERKKSLKETGWFWKVNTEDLSDKIFFYEFQQGLEVMSRSSTGIIPYLP